MIKNLSEKPIAELQKEQAEKWEKKICWENVSAQERA